MDLQSSLDSVTLMAMWGSIQEFEIGSIKGFEGPEKRLEIIVRFTDESCEEGLRSLPYSVWKEIISSLNACIVSKISNDYIDAYVLTESSLFVMKNRIILITCGTTTLLNSLSFIMDVVSETHGEIEWASFMRKNFSYPWEQKGPHVSMQEEIITLKRYFSAGKPFVFGPVDSDHYFFYHFDDVQRPCVQNDTQMSMAMYGLSKDLTKHLFSDAFFSTGPITQKIREDTGLNRLVNGWNIQDLQFEPCGYSINAIKDSEYQTMHITPEDHCSFSSYETNSNVANLNELLQTVLSVFKPKRFTVIVVIDPESRIGIAYHSRKAIGIEPENFTDYKQANRTMTELGHGQFIIKVNYVMNDSLLKTENKNS